MMLATETSDQARAAELRTLLARLRELCACDSPTGDNLAVDAVAGRISTWGREAGCEVQSFPTPRGGHLRLRLAGRGHGRVVLVGHHDTVWPVGTGARRPLTIAGETARGPGAADMKGGLLVGLAAIERLASRCRDDFGAVELHSLPDEEARVGPPARLDLLAGASAALVLECGREDGAVVSSRDAASWFEVDAQGGSSHAGSDPERGRSALRAILEEALRIEALDGELDGLRVTTTRMVSDGPENAIPGEAKATFDIRAPTQATVALALTRAERFGRHSGVTLSGVGGAGFPPMERDEELMPIVLDVLRRVGPVVGERHAGGASDGCWTSSLGVPTVDGLGPIGGGDHTEDEWIDMSSLTARIDAVTELCTLVKTLNKNKESRDGEH